jgi:hypothetical protein
MALQSPPRVPGTYKSEPVQDAAGVTGASVPENHAAEVERAWPDRVPSGENLMAKSGVLQATTPEHMRDWETQIKELKVKLHATRQPDKMEYYMKIKELQTRLSLARTAVVRKEESKA